MNLLDIFKELSNKILSFLLKIALLYSAMDAIFKESLKIKVDTSIKTLVSNMKVDGKINCHQITENRKITKDFMMVNMLKAKNKEKVNLPGLMDLLTKDPFKKACFLEKVSFWIKNKITLMKATLRADKNMAKEFKEQKFKVMKVFEFIIQGSLCLD